MDLWTKIDENLILIFAVLWFLGYSVIDKSDIEAMRDLSIGLLGFLGVFLAVIIVKGVVEALERRSKSLKKRYQPQIEKSIQKELKSESYDEKISH